jgi:hypothetical protein
LAPFDRPKGTILSARTTAPDPETIRGGGSSSTGYEHA